MAIQITTLNNLSEEVNHLYGYVEIPGDNFGEPAINSGPCGPFADAFFQCWNERFSDKVNIVFLIVKNSDECWHILIRLPNEFLFDGGIGVHDESYYKDMFDIIDMKDYDLQTLEKHAGGLTRKYPRYCPDFSMDIVTDLIRSHLNNMQNGNMNQNDSQNHPNTPHS